MNALDYLVKPVDPQRLEESLKRVRSKTHVPGEMGGMLSHSDRVFLNTGKKNLFLSVAKIAAITADKNYTNIMDVDGLRYMVRASLRDWEKRLPKDVFVVLDRSLMINRYHVQSWTIRSRGAEVFLTGIATPFYLGRTGYQRFKELVAAFIIENKS
ncbi:MAG: putative two-component response-regulatory protein YehT [Syntrophorhabdus sp. PtaU1.Bin058]|nr:MAG: putative two-component response-regulatory protein YehT [Syntrophorhabdus sp. PtaU1.Bin058]